MVVLIAQIVLGMHVSWPILMIDALLTRLVYPLDRGISLTSKITVNITSAINSSFLASPYWCAVIIILICRVGIGVDHLLLLDLLFLAILLVFILIINIDTHVLSVFSKISLRLTHHLIVRGGCLRRRGHRIDEIIIERLG